MAELVMERRFAAAPEKVFAFVTEPANLVTWWLPPGTTMGAHALDLSRPGPWHCVMVHPERGEFRMAGEVLELDPPRRVVFTMNVPGLEGDDSTVSFELAPDGGGTRFRLVQSGLSEMMAEHGKRGWAGPLDQLEAALAA